MKDEYLYENLINEIRKKIPKNSELVNKLVEILMIEKEAVYRRLRREVPFTFMEIANISKTLGVSLDNLVGIDTARRRSAFQLQMTEYIDPQPTDYFLMDEYVEVYRSSKNDKTSEMGTSSNIIPLTIFAGFPALRQFYTFKWNYHHENTKQIKSYHDLVISDRLVEIYEEIFLYAKNIATAYHIFDHLIFEYLVNDIKFFQSINLIQTKDVIKIKQEIYRLLDYLENLALNGIYEETNNKVYFYISDLNIDSNCFYIQSEIVKLSFLNSFILNSAFSLDEKTFYQLKHWINSIIRISNLITVTGERNRTLFFSSQRKIVAQL